MKAWNVYLEGKIIDTVFYDEDIDAEEVKEGLVDHDGYNPGIIVKVEPINPYLIEKTEEPIKCPNCAGEVTAQDILFNDGVETKKFKCDICGFKYSETWKFQKWEPDE